MLKDRVVLAIYMAELLKSSTDADALKTENIIADFRVGILGTRDKLADELETYTGGLDTLCAKS